MKFKQDKSLIYSDEEEKSNKNVISIQQQRYNNISSKQIIDNKGSYTLPNDDNE